MCRTLPQGTSHLAALTLSPPINSGAYAPASGSEKSTPLLATAWQPRSSVSPPHAYAVSAPQGYYSQHCTSRSITARPPSHSALAGATPPIGSINRSNHTTAQNQSHNAKDNREHVCYSRKFWVGQKQSGWGLGSSRQRATAQTF